jgi:NADP-dependent 3-hydroxy acid dehydrogenase YdfG
MAFIPAAKKDATIINISTAIAHLFPFPGFSSYAATKLAGSKFLSYVEGEYPELRVVNVHPGQVTETEMAGKAKDNEGSEHLRAHIDDGE